MRIPTLAVLALATLATGAAALATPARAQTYGSDYPVCLHVYGPEISYYECSYTSLAQCKASASGRAAQCEINPYVGRIADDRPVRKRRRY